MGRDNQDSTASSTGHILEILKENVGSTRVIRNIQGGVADIIVVDTEVWGICAVKYIDVNRSHPRLSQLKRLKILERERKFLEVIKLSAIPHVPKLVMSKPGVFFTYQYLEGEPLSYSGRTEHELAIYSSQLPNLVLHLEEITKDLFTKCRIVHLDIKKQNIIALCNGYCFALVDFGSARFVDLPNSDKEIVKQFSPRLGTGRFCHTPPELLLIHDEIILDRRLDVFGIGCLLVDIFLQKTPYSNICSDQHQAMKRYLKEEQEVWLNLHEHLAIPLAEAIFSCVRITPAMRANSLTGVLNALKGIYGSENIYKSFEQCDVLTIL